MPLVRISLVKGKPEAYRRKAGDAIHRALVETIGVPPLDRFQIVSEHEPGDLVYDSNYLGIARSSNRRIAVNLVEWRRRTGRSATASPRTRRRRPQP